MGNKSFVFRFADVEVREREFTLIKAGKALTVEPKAFRALLFLLHNPQRLISKEELLNSLWGDAAVTEGSLTRCIWLLRRLLEDDIHEPRYIETVATVGYRFVCPVEVSEDGGYGIESKHVSAETADGAIQAKPRSLRRWWLVAAAILVVGLASLIWYLRRPLPPPRISSYAQITHDGRWKWPMGTDGSRLYFCSGRARFHCSGRDRRRRDRTDPRSGAVFDGLGRRFARWIQFPLGFNGRREPIPQIMEYTHPRRSASPLG